MAPKVYDIHWVRKPVGATKQYNISLHIIIDWPIRSARYKEGRKARQRECGRTLREDTHGYMTDER